ncbi:MAG: metallophosphoesterase [Motiliproteus sp.]
MSDQKIGAAKGLLKHITTKASISDDKSRDSAFEDQTALTLTAVSDLHLMFDVDDPYQLPVPDAADLVLLAGDIADKCKTKYLDWILNATAGKPVAYTLGNHELYGSRRDKVARECRAAFAGSHVHFLLNESVVINGIRIAATDLWTDFQLHGKGPQAMREAEHQMNDYKKIRVQVRDGYGHRYRKLRATDTLGWHQEARVFIETTLNNSKEQVVLMTHHGTSRKCIRPGYSTGLLDAAYTSDLESLFERTKKPPVLCVHGHTHQHMCTRLDCGSVLYSNQRGYAHYERVPGYDPERLIQISESGTVTVDGYPSI